MSPRWIRPSARLLCACAVGSWIAACGKPAKPDPDAVNETPVNANARIVSQTMFGSAEQYSVAHAIRPADDGSFAFRGLYNSPRGVGVLNPDGSVRWFDQVSYEPGEVGTLPGSALVPHGLLVTGREDTNGDNLFDLGRATLYSSAGNLLSEIPVDSDSSSISIVGFAPVGDSTFIACGGDIRNGVEHPLLAVLYVRATGDLVRGRTVIVGDQIGRFGRIVTLPSSPGDLVIAATLLNGNSRSVAELRAPWPGFDAATVEWSHEIVSTVGPWVTLPGLEQSGGNIYLAGTVNDNRKPAASSGRPHDAGLAASYSGSGDLRWLSIVSLTQRSEGFYGLAVAPDAVYAVGHAAKYADTNNAFGYGLISKLDPNTGTVTASYTLGDDHYQSGFYGAIWTAGGLVCGGLTRLEYSNGSPIIPGSLPGTGHGWHQGWLATVNVNATP